MMYLWRPVLYAFLVDVDNPRLRKVCAMAFSLDKVESVDMKDGETGNN